MIKNALIEDIEIINNIGQTLYPNFSSIYKIVDYLKNDNYIILVNKDDSVNGFIIIYKNIDYYELEVIIVAEYARKKGIATKLLKYFIKEYCKKDDKILLEVSCENKAAIKLYKKFGFEIINIRKKYYKNVDAYIMEKVIK